ncbi:AP-3 complex subunit delta [Tilletia horrida]|uniref:AP-3 complex subunit delta n=1 Tax=Tilletia horrida TaxID=155126 RepID=A0AAN6GSM7_9BASI|nr:AP-3 complex subunit delta [Tilletia horrida]KAK0551290.1 AP-3 complex subunit delta [Tilletia horrida]KAK0567613.1 AP-3 complex subunit delta [Tilletia horrida]
MFERTLSSLIKGLRSHRGTKDEARYIAGVLEEIRNEVKSGDMQVKTEAVLKLTYLQMLGYSTAQASFHMLEVMASPKYHLKHVGYLAVSQCFTPQTDVLILATNMIKKDLHSPDALEVAAALNGLSHIMNADLASHLAGDIVKLLTHSRPAVRKRAILVLHAVITHFPDALTMAWDRLREKLEDPDPGVLSAAVNIVCELSRRDAKPFVALSPQLFKLLTTSTNNWMLIKLIKLFGILTPHEPRLVRKLLPPIRNIISTTPAMSLLYECIHTVIIGGMLVGPGGDELAQTCVEKLSHFLANSDQNLKYISLLALVRILPTQPHLLADHHETILASIEDPDLSIRLRALDLLSGLATRDTFRDIVTRLMRQLDPDPSRNGTSTTPKGSAAAALRATLGKSAAKAAANEAGTVSDTSVLPSYRLELAKRILDLGSTQTYANVIDFDWYIGVLINLALLPSARFAQARTDGRLGRRVARQIIDITARVRSVRSVVATKMVQMLAQGTLISSDGANGTEVLRAAAWVVGEYCTELRDPRVTSALLIRAPIEDEGLSPLVPSGSLTACVHNAVKVFAHWAGDLSDSWEPKDAGSRKQAVETVKSSSAEMVASLQIYAAHWDCEVQERASELLQIFRFLQAEIKDYQDTSAPPKSLHLLSPLFFGHALGPVAEKAQAQVPAPKDIDLYAWVVKPHSWLVVGDDTTAEPEETEDTASAGPSTPRIYDEKAPGISRSSSNIGNRAVVGLLDADLDNIPIVELRLDDVPVPSLSKSTVAGSRASTIASAPVFEEEELPEGATAVSAKKVVRKKVVSKEAGSGSEAGMAKKKKKRREVPIE